MADDERDKRLEAWSEHANANTPFPTPADIRSLLVDYRALRAEERDKRLEEAHQPMEAGVCTCSHTWPCPEAADIRSLLADYRALKAENEIACCGKCHEKAFSDRELRRKAEAERDRLREAGQRCMEISTALAAADIVGHQNILDVMGRALASGEER